MSLGFISMASSLRVRLLSRLWANNFDDEIEGDFLSIWHKELPWIVAASGGAIVLLNVISTASILGGESMFDSSDVRSICEIYLIHQVFLMTLGFLLVILGVHAYCRSKLATLEYMANSIWALVFVLLPLCNPWRVSRLWGQDPDVLEFAHEQAESHLALALSGAISVLCNFSRVRIHLLWIPVAAGSISYFVITETCKVMPGGESPSRITEFIIFVLAVNSLVGAWMSERQGRQSFSLSIKNGLLDVNSNKAHPLAVARVLRACCDAVLEVSSSQTVISADGLIGPLFGQTVVGQDVSSLWPSEELRMKAILEQTSDKPCLVHTMSAALAARTDKSAVHVEIFAVRVSPDDEGEVKYQWLLGLRKTSEARIPMEARKRDRDSCAITTSPANRSTSPSSRKGHSPQCPANSPQFHDATTNSPLSMRHTLKPASIEVVSPFFGGKPPSADLTVALDLQDHNYVRRSDSWPTKNEGRWSGRSQSFDQSLDDGMVVADEPTPAQTRVFQVPLPPVQLQNGQAFEGNGFQEDDDVMGEHGTLQHQESTTSLTSTATAAGPLIVQTTDRRRRFFAKWASERAFLGSVNLPTEVFFESDDPLVVDQLRCTIIQCGLRLRRFGLRPGDCITHVDDEVVSNSDVFRQLVCKRWEKGVETTVDLTFRRVQEWHSNRLTDPSDDNSSDKVTWRSMSSKAAANGMGLPSKALHDAKAKEFWKKTRLNRTSSSIGSTVHEEKEENTVALRLQMRRLSRTSSCIGQNGSTGTDTPPDLEFLDS